VAAVSKLCNIGKRNLMGKIIDVSANNGLIDWSKVANDGVTDVIIRLSLGFNTKDKKADAYSKAAAAAGIRVSYYHFAYPDKKTGETVVDDAKNEANYFTRLFKGGLMPAPHWLALDLEKWENDADSPLNKNEYLQWVVTFLHEVYNATGKTCLLYSNTPYLNSHLPPTHGLGQVPLWISNYNPVTKPPLPKGWKDYYMWQYSEKGRIRGINGFCDLNKRLMQEILQKLAEKSSKPVGKAIQKKKAVK
jgi:lysozyme